MEHYMRLFTYILSEGIELSLSCIAIGSELVLGFVLTVLEHGLAL